MDSPRCTDPRCPRCHAITTVEEDDLGRFVCVGCDYVWTTATVEPDERPRRDLD